MSLLKPTSFARVGATAVASVLLLIIGEFVCRHYLPAKWPSVLRVGMLPAIVVIITFIAFRRFLRPDLGLRMPANMARTFGVATLGYLPNLVLMGYWVFGLALPLKPYAGLLLLKLCVAQGIMEEMIYRGYAFAALRETRTHNRAAFLGGVVFGLVHLLNLIGSDLGSWETWFSVAVSVCFGFALTFPAVRIFEAAGMSIWPWAISHTIIDSFNLVDVSSEPQQVYVMLAVTISSCLLQYWMAARWLPPPQR